MCGYSLLSMLILLYNYRANYPVPASLHLWPTTNYSVNLSLSLMTQWLRITNTALSPGTWPGHTILLNFFITIKHKIQQPLEIFIKFLGFHQIFFFKIFRSMEKHYLIIFFFVSKDTGWRWIDPTWLEYCVFIPVANGSVFLFWESESHLVAGIQGDKLISDVIVMRGQRGVLSSDQ